MVHSLDINYKSIVGRLHRAVVNAVSTEVELTSIVLFYHNRSLFLRLKPQRTRKLNLNISLLASATPTFDSCQKTKPILRVRFVNINSFQLWSPFKKLNYYAIGNFISLE